ncbi:HIRA-interacting protein 5 [Linderina pennispora]|uniref:HIRA-interacting protein 5 n=1 Tax=Linderina pennispora TaxID=61395 RepID=A0A1Y1W283_9FUNG|nr:HIRA-interacting protein 5 [Linderina pennispora]ORX67234.1 HIRA-interacting protein 5 [Linderina pennispora]
MFARRILQASTRIAVRRPAPARRFSSILPRPTPTTAKPTPFLQQYRTMFIQTATTPNEDALQFIPGVPVLEDTGSRRTVEYTSPRDGLKSPLATRLFAIEGVKGVMYGSDFVTVRKEPDYPWQLMKPDIYAAIMDHFSSGRSLIREDEEGQDSMSVGDQDSDIVAEIKELLESRVRPSIQEDGGDLDFVSFNEGTGIVKIRLRGACRGCASSSVTLKHGVEGMLSYYIPEVTGVEDVGDELEAQAKREFDKLEAELNNKQSS